MYRVALGGVIPEPHGRLWPLGMWEVNTVLETALKVATISEVISKVPLNLMF